MTRKLFIKCVAGLLAFSIGAGHVEAAVPKGESGSSERKHYCTQRLRACIGVLDDACGESPGAGQEDSVEIELCRSSETQACNKAWGNESDCLTRNLVSGASWELERYGSGDDVFSAPEEKQQPLRKSLRLKGLNTNPVTVRETKESGSTESRVSLKPNQKLLLTNGNHVEHFADGSVHIIIMNGRTAQSFPGGVIVKDKDSKVSILSGGKRVEAGVFKAIQTSVVRRDQRKTRDHR